MPKPDGFLQIRTSYEGKSALAIPTLFMGA
jgi:hypothetical protein